MDLAIYTAGDFEIPDLAYPHFHQCTLCSLGKEEIPIVSLSYQVIFIQNVDAEIL